MEIIDVSLGILLSASLSANIFLYFFKKRPTVTTTMGAPDLLRDLLNGSAIIKIDVINPGDILIRSPRS